MTALLRRLLSDRPHRGRLPLPAPSPRRVTLAAGDAPFAATGERLVTRNELDALQSLHPRRISVGRSPAGPTRRETTAGS